MLPPLAPFWWIETLAASREYVNKRVSLEKLTDDIEEYFQDQGYKTQRLDQEKGNVVQAQKAGVLRDLVAGDRAFTVVVAGQPDNLKISIGVGKWLQNLAVSIVEAALLTPLLFFVEIPLSLWSYEIEGEIWKFIDQQVKLRSAGNPR
jgi:hypothetical protein